MLAALGQSHLRGGGPCPEITIEEKELTWARWRSAPAGAKERGDVHVAFQIPARGRSPCYWPERLQGSPCRRGGRGDGGRPWELGQAHLRGGACPPVAVTVTEANCGSVSPFSEANQKSKCLCVIPNLLKADKKQEHFKDDGG